jgi:hypothetical protein
MEQHPIPQDVTGFQFKLIGTMTVKQFGYVAVGAILAVVAWYAPVSGFIWQVITKGILVPLFGASGVIVAFVPIEGRPVDVMTMNFLHALLSPNQYVYIKKGRKLSFTQVTYTKVMPQANTAQQTVSRAPTENSKEEQLRALLAGSYKNAKNNLDKKELAFLQSFTPLPQPTPIQQTKPTSPHISTQTHTYPAAQPVQRPPRPIAPPTPTDHPNHNILTPAASSAKTQTQSIGTMQEATTHKIPAANKNPGAGLLSDTPNIITGLVKDPRGNMLQNILVEIKDKEGTPVRAFKTNPLGQFASATPIADGNYTIELEDPKKQHAFDTISIIAKGQILQPVEITSHDAREELRKALFN